MADFERIELTAENADEYIDRLTAGDREIMSQGDLDADPGEGGWLVARLKCIACFKQWVGVFPAENDADFFECPRCGKMAGEKQPLDDDV